MKTFVCFGFEFAIHMSISRFKRYAVLIQVNEGEFEEMSRFDNLEAAADNGIEHAQRLARDNFEKRVVLQVLDRKTQKMHGQMVFEDGWELVRYMTASGTIGKRSF